MTDHSNSTCGTRSEFLAVMRERGFIAACTDERGLVERMSHGPAVGYAGFDATARSLHVGHLLPLMALRWFAATGNHAVALMGGATTLVGDPSFRNAARPLLGTEAIEGNAAAIEVQIRRILDPAGRVSIVDNAEWLGRVGFIDFLRDVGRHFTVARMLAMESVRSRLDDGLSALEFSYMLLQAADFAELARRMDCVLQLGGSDQWGNICNGIDLARRRDGRDLFGLTTPLLETASGTKMGKSAGGAIWLDPEMREPFEFWQFWRNTEDADVPRFLRLFTELPLDEIERISALGGREINEAKKVLATEVTSIIHGADAATNAAIRAVGLFEDGNDASATHVVKAGIGVPELLVSIGFASSRGEGRRLIRGAGVRIGGTVVKDEFASFASTEGTEVRVGKRRRAIVTTR